MLTCFQILLFLLAFVFIAGTMLQLIAGIYWSIKEIAECVLITREWYAALILGFIAMLEVAGILIGILLSYMLITEFVTK